MADSSSVHSCTGARFGVKVGTGEVGVLFSREDLDSEYKFGWDWDSSIRIRLWIVILILGVRNEQT